MKLCGEKAGFGVFKQVRAHEFGQKGVEVQKNESVYRSGKRGEVDLSVDLFTQVDPSIDLGPGHEFSCPARVSVLNFEI